MNADKNRTM